jgi:hypothetical protein
VENWLLIANPLLVSAVVGDVWRERATARARFVGGIGDYPTSVAAKLYISQQQRKLSKYRLEESPEAQHALYFASLGG